MIAQELIGTAMALVASDKGLLAMDESTGETDHFEQATKYRLMLLTGSVSGALVD